MSRILYIVTAVILNHIAAGVLYLLWKRRRNMDGSLVQGKVLHKELLEGQAKTEFREDLQVVAVKKALRQLRAAGLVEFGQSKKGATLPGPAPNGYRLAVDAPIITWRATAAIIMMLHNHTERRLKRETFINEAVRLGLTHHNRDQRLGPEEISALVDWCVRREYIKEEEVMIDQTSARMVEKRLITTSKVDDHELFLQMIAKEVKRQAASEPSSSAYAGGELQKQG